MVADLVLGLLILVVLRHGSRMRPTAAAAVRTVPSQTALAGAPSAHLNWAVIGRVEHPRQHGFVAPYRCPGEVEVGKPGQEGREGDFRLQAGQRRTQAVVDPAGFHLMVIEGGPIDSPP